jgi:hypothetical protein
MHSGLTLFSGSVSNRGTHLEKEDAMNQVWSLFWVFIIFVSLLPLLQKKMMDLFPQANPQRPSVQYIPVLYKKSGEKQGR